MDKIGLTISDVAELLNVHRDAVSRLAKSGILPGYTIGKRWYTTQENVMSFIHSGGEAQTAKPIPHTKYKPGQKLV